MGPIKIQTDHGAISRTENYTYVNPDCTKIDFEGFALGGLAVGESQDIMFKTISFTNPFLDVFELKASIFFVFFL